MVFIPKLFCLEEASYEGPQKDFQSQIRCDNELSFSKGIIYFLTSYWALTKVLSFRICLKYVSYTPKILNVYALNTKRICLEYETYMP